MYVCAAFEVILASVTLYVYSSYYKSLGYAILEKHHMLKSSFLTVDNIATVANIYALIVLVIGIITFLLACIAVKKATLSRGVTIWLWFCVVFTLLTRDFVGLALYSITLAIYSGRNKAIRAYRAALAHSRQTGSIKQE